MNKVINFDHAVAKVYGFDNGTDVTEYQVVISLTNPLLTYTQQLETLVEAFAQVKKEATAGASVVFKRFFLSDASNQADELMNYEMEAPAGALSIIQQAPLNGTKIALWAYLATGMQTRALASGLYEASHGGYRHLWLASAHNNAKDSERQTRILLNDYVM